MDSASKDCNLVKKCGEYLVCPYDESHHVLPRRMPVHLVRCARNHPGNRCFTCVYNTSHVVHPDDLKEHLENCEDYKEFLHVKSANTVPPLEPKDSIKHLTECEENWDDEPDVGTYNPQTYCENNLVIRTLMGATKKERRDFREEQRKKMKDANNK